MPDSIVEGFKIQDFDGTDRREAIMVMKCAAAAAVTLVLTAGCAHYGALEEDYGKSYGLVLQGQVLNPDASKNRVPVTGLDGGSAEEVMKKYRESFGTGDCNTSPGTTAPPIPAGKGMGHDIYGK
jgi:hypothetical protein